MVDESYKRIPLSSLLGIQLSLRTAHETNDIANDQLVLVRRDNGKKVATVAKGDLFDPEGMRFFADC